MDTFLFFEIILGIIFSGTLTVAILGRAAKKKKGGSEMKRMISILIIFITALMFSGCALTWVDSHADLEKDENGKVTKSQYSRKVTGLSLNDPETANSWARADRMARSTQGSDTQADMNIIEVDMKNYSSFGLEVEDGEFKGLILSPGEESAYTRQVSPGPYTFHISYVDKNGRKKRREISRFITSETQSIILKDVWR